LLPTAGTQHLQGLPETIEEYLEGPGEATCMVFNPFGTILATGCRGGGVVLWSYEIRSAVRTFSGVHG